MGSAPRETAESRVKAGNRLRPQVELAASPGRVSVAEKPREWGKTWVPAL